MPDTNGHSEAPDTGNPTDWAQWHRDLRECLIFLTRLPVSRLPDSNAPSLAAAMRAFGLAGAVVGLASAVILGAALWCGLNSVIASLLAVATATIMTGALHEDGLADVADGFGGGATTASKLEIMRDSRIGAFGVLALIVAVAEKIFALASVIDNSTGLAPLLLVIAIAIQSRAFTGVLMHILPNARSDGRSADAGRPTRSTINQLVASSALISLPLVWWAAGLWAMTITVVISALALAGFARLCRRQIGGQTGDCLGAMQQIIEVVQLLTLAALLS